MSALIRVNIEHDPAHYPENPWVFNVTEYEPGQSPAEDDGRDIDYGNVASLLAAVKTVAVAVLDDAGQASVDLIRALLPENVKAYLGDLIDINDEDPTEDWENCPYDWESTRALAVRLIFGDSR